MRESVQNLVQAIAQGDALETEKAFATAMAEKLAPMLDARRAEVAQSMFTAPDNVVTEQVNEINEESDAALEMAHRVASKNKNLRVEPHGYSHGVHMIVHKDTHAVPPEERDGAEDAINVSSGKNGHIHIEHQIAGDEGSKKFKNHEEAEKHLTKLTSNASD